MLVAAPRRTRNPAVMDKQELARHRRAMADIINLRMARKAKTRADAATRAAQNRARFGRSKVEKAIEAADAERTAKLLDQARRETE